MSETKLVADPTIAELAELRARVNDGYRWLLEARGSAAAFNAGVERYRQLGLRYVAALLAWCDQIDEADLRELRGWYAQRLEKGWLLAETPEVVERFHAVLGEYEVVCDALLGVDAVDGQIAARVRFVTAIRRPEVRQVAGVWMEAQ